MVQNDTHGLAYCGTRPYPEITETTEYVQIKEEKHMKNIDKMKNSIIEQIKGMDLEEFKDFNYAMLGGIRQLIWKL